MYLSSRLRIAAILILTGATMPACTSFPQLDAAISDTAENAPAPDLIDHRRIVGPALDTRLTESAQTDLKGRAAALQSGAATLSGPVMTEAERQALSDASVRLRDQASGLDTDQ